MALSARFSPRSDNLSERDQEVLNKARSLFEEYRDWFISEFGSVVCRDVQLKQFGRYFNFMDKEDIMAFSNFPEREKCNLITRKGARKIAEILSR